MTHRVERIGSATRYLADCRDVLPTLSGVDAVVTDPPYPNNAGHFLDGIAAALWCLQSVRVPHWLVFGLRWRFHPSVFLMWQRIFGTDPIQIDRITMSQFSSSILTDASAPVASCPTMSFHLASPELRPAD